MITDEIVEKAHRALLGYRGVALEDAVRAAIEAVESDLLSAARAEGMEETLGEFRINANGSFPSEGEEDTYRRIQARISSLKPKTTDEAKP